MLAQNRYKRAFSRIKQTTRTRPQTVALRDAEIGSFLRFKKFYTYIRAAHGVRAAFDPVHMHRTLHAASRIPYYTFILRNISPLVKGEAPPRGDFFM